MQQKKRDSLAAKFPTEFSRAEQIFIATVLRKHQRATYDSIAACSVRIANFEWGSLDTLNPQYAIVSMNTADNSIWSLAITRKDPVSKLYYDSGGDGFKNEADVMIDPNVPSEESKNFSIHRNLRDTANKYLYRSMKDIWITMMSQ